MDYQEFLHAKIKLAEQFGFDVADDEINPILKPHQRDMVRWMVRMGRAACFAAFGLGKSVIQLETVRIVLARCQPGGMGLIVIPLGVRQEFIRDAAMLGVPVKFIRRIEECDGPGIYLTNYETVRDGKLDPQRFTVASLDEAGILRGFGGTKTFREFMATFAGDRKTMSARTLSDGVKYRFVATATPSPNEYIEMLAYAAFLGVMDVGAGKTRFFKRDSTKADVLTLHPHKEKEFWLWVASWAIFVQKPSDLGHSDEGYSLPDMEIHWHEIPSDHSSAGVDFRGQGLLIKEQAIGISMVAKEKRSSMDARIAKMMELRAIDPDAHRVIWHDLEDERRALEKTIPNIVTVYGSLEDEQKTERIIAFSDGKFQELGGKPSMLGQGCNLQRHCAWAIFLGIGFKFSDLIQACHRVNRFLQTRTVRIDFIYTESEREVRRVLERKWEQHKIQVENMTKIIQEYGLSSAAMAETLKRAMGVERIAVDGENFSIVNNDCVKETGTMPDNSVDLILTSVPFSTQYEYSPNFADFGHTDNNVHFFEQMDFLTPQLLRTLKPGRIAAIHVKDRVVPGGLTGLGYQTVYPFHAKCIEHYTRHGFGYMGMITIVTDVVRENNQTYRLGWSEVCKDGSKMSVGMPEYLLLFRKAPTDTTDSYADEPVTKTKAAYSRSRWQTDAHSFWRSNGNRLMTPEELEALDHDIIFRWFRDFHMMNIYDFEHHVRIGETMDATGRLPVTFMLLQPPSWMDAVWTDVARMRTLNMLQEQKGKEMHLCLARGSLVLTRDGHVPIERVEAGSEVLTHLGRWRKVLSARMTGESREVVDLRAHGVAGLRLTPDHKLWARLADGARAVDAASKAEPGWLEASESIGHYVNAKLPPVEPSELTIRECWLIGRWLADGHIGTRGDYWVSVGPDKFGAFERCAGPHAGTRSEGTAVQVRLKGLSELVREILARCGRGAGGKVVPGELLALPEDLARSVLDGYLSGDGHLVQSRNRWQATSVSRALLLGIAILAQRVHHTIASLSAGRPAGEAIIQGRTVTTRQEWVLSFDDGASVGRKRPFMLDDGAWKRVRSADPAGVEEVWCLKVEDDESFTAEGCIVKNCPMQFDIADRIIERFTNRGDTVFDPFAGIGSVGYRAILKNRRFIGTELSHRYFMDSAYYLKAAESEMSMPSLFDSMEPREDIAA
jgi:DNA modification methylase